MNGEKTSQNGVETITNRARSHLHTNYPRLASPPSILAFPHVKLYPGNPSFTSGVLVIILAMAENTQDILAIRTPERCVADFCLIPVGLSWTLLQAAI